MLVTHQIKIDLQAPGIVPAVNAVQLDSNTRVIKAALYSGGIPFALDSSAEISLACIKPDRTKCWYDQLSDGTAAMSIDGNTVSVTLAPEVLTVAGTVTAALVIRDDFANQISTFPFAICVSFNPAADGAISNNYYKISNLEAFNSWIADVVCCTPQNWSTEKQAQARNNIGAMAAGVQRTLAINSTDTPGADVTLQTEAIRDSGTNALYFYTGDFNAGEERLTALGHIADGEQATDAATVGQLNALADRFPLPNEMFFDIDDDGIVSLKPEYRGSAKDETYPYAVSDNGVGTDGSLIDELPEKLVIPDIIDGTAVAGCQVAMFHRNNRIKEITIPDAVTELPDRFCSVAKNLIAIHNTEQVTKLGNFALNYTKIEKAIFPNLRELGTNCFTQAYNLYVVDIGNFLSEIPKYTFAQAVRLSLVKGGSNVKTIGDRAFYITLNLKNLPLLSQVTSIGKLAFFQSRIQFDWSSIEGQCNFEERATPVSDNTTDYWSNVIIAPCENDIVTRMQQTNPEWKDGYFGEFTSPYYKCCHIFAVLHIHSALSGKLYNHPDEFAEEVRAIDPELVTDDRDPGTFEDVAYYFDKLGYKATEYTEEITEDIFRELCDALARGAYVYQQISMYPLKEDAPEGVDPDAFAEYYTNAGHVVALYGINDKKEVLVLDSGCPSDITLYRMPYQNLTGPTSNFVIVEKKEE